jgi:phenylpropionate dioxygenase-like ring-hydroxylating dioxygenase large terminal subunit
MFMRNCWYVAAWDDEIGGETPFGRTILGEPVVLFRDSKGTVAALEDRCRHRHLPLSLGKVVGDTLQCGYHGLQYGPTGDCVKIPGQNTVPPGATIDSYPVVERWGWVWIWMGDVSRADESLIPDWRWMDHPDWKVTRGNGGKPLPINCHYELVNDNILDLSHLPYVHADTIGAESIVDYPVKTERIEGGVMMTRQIVDRPPAPFFKMAGGFMGNVDRRQNVIATVPSHCDVDVASDEVGSGVLEYGGPPQGTAMHALITTTPVTETTSLQFYAHPRFFGKDDPKMDEIFRTEFTRIFLEDVVIMEKQQASIDRLPSAAQIEINVDAPAIAFRNVLGQHVAAERSREAAE